MVPGNINELKQLGEMLILKVRKVSRRSHIIISGTANDQSLSESVSVGASCCFHMGNKDFSLQWTELFHQ